jgi:predicted phage baseplate assembly protein
MPLAAELPVIDNRTFTDIVAEAQTRIPRYTQEWTDFNPGDAGFALVELFAWMSELLIYRLGQVPLLNYIKFLQLIGIELTSARPSTTVILFPVQASYALAAVPVPARTQIAATVAGSAAPIVFETSSAITAVQAGLDAVLAYDGFSYTDQSAANIPAGAGFAPFGPLADAGSALLLGFNPPAGLPPGVELSIGIWPATPRGLPPPSPCGGGAASVYAPATIVWDFWAGTDWSPLKILGDTTIAFTEPGLVRLKLPPAGQIAPAKLGGKKDTNRAWLRARLATASYEIAPVLTCIAANAAAATAAQTVLAEVLGGSAGTPNQTFALSSAPVLAGTLTLQIDEGSGFATWTEVDDFAAAGPNDPVYLLDEGSGTVTFGDGVLHGAIPTANLANPNGNIVAASYRFGGGAATNIAAGTALTLMTSLPGIDAGKISTPFAAYGGADEESLQNAMDRAPQALQSQNRAVTAADFEMLAVQAGPISRAKALPLTNPNFPGQSIPGTVTVIVVPNVPVPAPMPSPGLLRTVCAYLDQRRLITTELYVCAPTYLPVTITLDVLAQPDADTGAAELAVEAAISTFLDPRLGGADGTGWPFGGTIYFVDLLRTALVADVIRVANLVITLNSIAAPACTDVPLPAGALLAVQSVTASVFTDPAALDGTS